MKVYFAWLLVIFSAVVMFLLVLRFILPELLYTLRDSLREVKATKLFRDTFAGRVTKAGALWALLGDDLRYESHDHSEEYVHTRVNRVRKTYRVLSRRSPAPGFLKKRRPQACIVELAGLLNSMARHMKPEGKFHYHTTDASQLLGFIASEVRRKNDEPPLESNTEVAEWFTNHPISIEQTIEILIAAVLALAYRQREQQTMYSRGEGGAPGDEEYPETPGSPLGLAAARASHDAEEKEDAEGRGGHAAEHAGAGSPVATAGGAHAVAPKQVAAGPSDAGRDGGGGAVRVFVSYSHRDAKYLGTGSLVETLKGLSKEGVEFWSDESITAGDKWDDKIKARITESHIALVLVSQAFLDSPYCQNVEIMSFLTEAEQRRSLVIMPVMLSPCEWERHDWLKERQFLPTGGRSIERNYITVGRRKELFIEIRDHLRRQVEAVRRGFAR